MNYRDEKDIIRAELLDEEAKRIAETFIKNDPKLRDKTKFSLTSAQLRRFFGEFRQLEKKVNNPSIGFEKVKPLIKMVKSKASYASNPDRAKIPITFRDFLINNINQIDTDKDFKDFMLHFEAVVGFCYGLGMKD